MFFCNIPVTVALTIAAPFSSATLRVAGRDTFTTGGQKSGNNTELALHEASHNSKLAYHEVTLHNTE